MNRYIAALAVLVGVAVPSFAFAQTSGNSLLSVYVQVINPQSGQQYYYPYGTQSRTAADFSVQVSGNNPSPATFWGSNNGVQVSLNSGTYSVTLSGNQYGYTPSYSAGCNGTATAGGTGLCVITVSPSYSSHPYPSPYPYPYQQPSMRCAPEHQTVGLRQNATFTAVGGVGGTYNWRAGGRDYPNVGPVLTVSFEQTGSQLVTVTNANLTSTCEVTVQNTYYPVAPVAPVYPTYPQNPTLHPIYYPRLPNTGVEPLTAAQVAMALALLGAATAVALPHVRKAFAIISR